MPKYDIVKYLIDNECFKYLKCTGMRVKILQVN